MAATHYDILGVATTADAAAIKKAYRRRVRIYHPDRNHDPRAVEQFCLVQRAYETLSSPRARFEYDRQIGVLDTAGRRVRQAGHDRPTTVLHPHDSQPQAPHGRSSAEHRRGDEPVTGWRRLERGLIALDVLLLLVVIHQAVLTVLTFRESSSATSSSWVESSSPTEPVVAEDARFGR